MVRYKVVTNDNIRLALNVDIFNLLNDDTYEGVRSTNVTSSNFNLPADFSLPRRLQFGAKLRF